jgi:hypothetical protein
MNLHDELRDPQPPVPGERERELVAARAHQLHRRRRLAQGAVGALAVVAAVSVSVAALTGGGSSDGTGRIEAASVTSGTTAVAPTTTAAPATTAALAPAPAPAPAPTAAPEPAADTTPAPAFQAPAPAVQEAPPAPTSFNVSGTVTGVPAGATLTVRLHGTGGEFSATADGAGHYAIGGVPAGSYEVIWQWVDSSGTATQATRAGTVDVQSDVDVSFGI